VIVGGSVAAKLKQILAVLDAKSLRRLDSRVSTALAAAAFHGDELRRFPPGIGVGAGAH
jgi:hypothetical protein